MYMHVCIIIGLRSTTISVHTHVGMWTCSCVDTHGFRILYKHVNKEFDCHFQIGTNCRLLSYYVM